MLKRFFSPGAWTAIFTGILMIFSGLLWKVSDKANEASITSQRAFISFAGPAIVADIQNKQLRGTNVYWGMSNSGTTPANDIIFEWNLSLGQTIPGKDVDFDSLPQNEREKLVLGPKASYQFKPVYLSVQDWESVTEGKQHLFFWGWAVYRDVFNGTAERLSEFCTDITNAVWTTDKHTDPTGGVSTINPPCPTHNCYDEGCEDYERRTQE